MHAILIWFDRLPYGLLECCGNTGGRTPGFNRLAAECVTFDRCFATDLRENGSARIAQSMIDLAMRGIKVRMIADEPTKLSERLGALTTDGSPAVETSLHASINDELISYLAREAMDAEVGRSQLTVLSLPGVPANAIDWKSDAVTAAVARADELMERFLSHIREVPSPQDLLLLVGASAGLAVDGTRADSSFQKMKEWSIHVPMFGRSDLPLRFGVRCSSLVCTADAAATLQSHFDMAAPVSDAKDLIVELRGGDTARRESLLVRGADDHCGLLTDDWYLVARLPTEQDAGNCQRAAESASLFMKPDDLWDQLDVASQSPEVVESLVGRAFEVLGAKDEQTEGSTSGVDSPKIAKDFD